MPLLNSNAEVNTYTNLLVDDGKRLISDAGYGLVNNYANQQIRKIPFFAQTTISINGATDAGTGLSIDSLMKLNEIAVDEEGDLKTLLFSQVKFSKSTSSDGSTTNLGIGIRHRPNDESMLGANAFWDYRATTYSSSHSRLGLGGEYLKKGLEFRNNWYMSITGNKNVNIGGTDFIERVVPGWDAEIGYRFARHPEMAVFAKAFNWDYRYTQDNSGLEGSFNWQATPYVNLEAWVSNQIAAGTTVHNGDLPGINETFFGLRMKWTGRPVKFNKQNTKQNMITQMTQPVRRRYDVLLERSVGGFINRATTS